MSIHFSKFIKAAAGLPFPRWKSCPPQHSIMICSHIRRPMRWMSPKPSSSLAGCGKKTWATSITDDGSKHMNHRSVDSLGRAKVVTWNTKRMCPREHVWYLRSARPRTDRGSLGPHGRSCGPLNSLLSPSTLVSNTGRYSPPRMEIAIPRLIRSLSRSKRSGSRSLL